MLKFHTSFVFDGEPPDMKKKELAKRYTLNSAFALIVSCECQYFYFLCLPLFRSLKRDGSSEDLNRAIEVI
mgnify:CR=1 FL=1